MKKMISLLLVLTMVAAMAAGCGPKAEVPEKKNLEGSMQDNINKVLEKNPIELMMAEFMPVDLTNTTEEGLWMVTNNTGLKDGSKLSDLAVYEPMVGSTAFSLVMARVKDAAEAKNVAQEMHDNIDTRKWICVQADEMMVAGYGDVVMLIMLDSSLGATAQSFVDAFKTVCGGELDFTI